MKLDPQAVREARERLGYSIDKTGEEGDLSPNSVLRAEHGEEIRPSTARRLARALNVEVKDLYPKGERRSSLEPSFNDVLEEGRREEEEFSAAVRRYLIPLLDSYTLVWSERIEDYGPPIANLPEDLTPRESFAAYQWVARFIQDCERMEEAVEKAGVMEAVVDKVLGRAQEGGRVPADILQKARAFLQAHHRLFVEVELSALRWIETQCKRPDVVAFSEEKRKADEGAAKASVVLAFANFKHLRSGIQQRRQQGEARGGGFAANEADAS